MAVKRTQKNLTVMFTDISGFTRHTETISRDDLMARLDTHNELLMPIIAHFEGRIVKTIGDAFLITFESPTNAVQCGLFMQHTLRQFNTDKPENQQIHIKVSINSGEVTVTENDVFGDPVNVAAKIEKATNPDEIYFTESVFLAMNKSEVPTSFVKAFRPKGAESSEIKLYKVAMDEGDERYRKIISGTDIRADENQTKVRELSSTAEKEFVRYQDALEALMESQGKSSRGVVLAVVIAALILAAAVFGGIAMFAGGESEEAKTIESARLFLSNDKPDDARQLLLNYAAKNGNSDSLKEALGEVNAYVVNRAAREAREFIESARPERAVSVLRRAVGDNEVPAEIDDLLARAEAYVAAREALAEGDTEAVRAKLEIAEGNAGATPDMRLMRRRADALDQAREIVDDPRQLERNSNTAIESLSEAWQGSLDRPVVREPMVTALKSRLYWEARNRGYAEGRRLFDEYRDRFPSVGDWSRIEWEVDLGGYWNYADDFEMSRQWHKWGNKAWEDHRRRVNAAAKEDPGFALRAAETIVGINDKIGVVISSGQDELKLALDAKPELVKTERERIVVVLRSLLTKDLHDGSYARELARGEFYDDLRAYMAEGLYAIHEFTTDNRPNFTLRGNCYAIMADRADLGVIDDPFGYYRDNFSMFMDSIWPRENADLSVTRGQVARLFQLEFSREEYGEFVRFLEGHAADIASRSGPWGSNIYAAQMVREMLEDLRNAKPQYAELEE